MTTNGQQQAAGLNIIGGAAIVAPVSAFPNGVPGNALIVIPMSKPTDELKGSAVGGVSAPDLIAAKLTDVIANMRGWAVAAHMSADAFERADRRSADRFHRP